MNEWNESNASNEPKRTIGRLDRTNGRTVTATLAAMRRRTPPSERPKLTLVDGDLPDEDAERVEARRRHPTATERDGGGLDGPEAV